MRILILGGTRFVGRHITQAALANGHEVTLFHRGQSNPDLFSECEHVFGDRDQSFDPLKGKTWDAIVDTCAYVPRQVRTASEALRGSSNYYLFISTISVYDQPYEESPTESHKLIELEDKTVEEVTKDTYGGLKVLCEREANRHWGADCWNFRPGVVVGPWDSTDRFTYWVTKFAGGKDYVAPPRLSQPIQGVDARDLAEFAILGIENRITGAHNVVGRSTTFEGLISEGNLIWQDGAAIRVSLPPEDLEKLPMVLPVDGSMDGIFSMNPDAALKVGFKQRPLAETLNDIWKWQLERGDSVLKVGLSAEREAELLNNSSEEF